MEGPSSRGLARAFTGAKRFGVTEVRVLSGCYSKKQILDARAPVSRQMIRIALAVLIDWGVPAIAAKAKQLFEEPDETC